MNVVSIGIACVPERLAFAKDMRAKLLKHLPPEFVNIGLDEHHRGSWHGHHLALLAKHPEATHHLTLEDDVVFRDDFIPSIYRILDAVPDEVISLYATRTNMPKSIWARKQGYHWYCDAHGASGQAVIMPVKLLADFLNWEKRCPPKMPYEDSRLWGWMYESNLYTWNPVPHLTDHAMPMNSTLGFNSQGKVAGDFIAEGEGLSIDWTMGVQELRKSPRPKRYEWGEDDYMKWVGKYRKGVKNDI